MYNPTCIISGRTDNLRMYPHRNKEGHMIGWFFIHETYEKDLRSVTISFQMELNRESDTRYDQPD